MTPKTILQPAYILHQRPYRETSVIVEFFTQQEGRLAAVAKGVRKPHSRARSLLQPFIPLLITVVGRGELKTLTQFECEKAPLLLRGDCLFAALYLNELLMRLLQKEDPHPMLYTIYHQTLLEFQQGQLQQKDLRLFEKKMLDELGYGLQFQYDIENHQPFAADRYYYFYPEQGFKYCEEGNITSPYVFSGKSILAFLNEEWEEDESLTDAKRLMRLALSSLLGEKPLESRKLFT